MHFDSSTTLKTLFEQEYLPSNLRITSVSTIRHYNITLRQFSEHLGREALLGDLTDLQCTRYCRWLQETKTLSEHTITQRMNYLRAFWRWCSKLRYVDKFPTFQERPAAKPIPRAWTIPQIESLLKSCRDTKGKIGRIPAGTWWYNLHRFCWETGERIGAILQAQWDHVDAERCLVEIPAKYRKGNSKGMLYTISRELMDDLMEMRRADEPLLFPMPHTTATFYNRYARILKRAGLPTDHRSKFHRMRRSFASHLEAAGGNATEALKHITRKITSESYLDETIIQRTPAYQMLPKLKGGDE